MIVLGQTDEEASYRPLANSARASLDLDRDLGFAWSKGLFVQ